MGFFKKLFSKEKKETLDNGLERTKQGFFGKLTRAIAGKQKIDDEILDNLEEVFVRLARAGGRADRRQRR